MQLDTTHADTKAPPATTRQQEQESTVTATEQNKQIIIKHKHYNHLPEMF
jgi:hypothetical protein